MRRRARYRHCWLLLVGIASVLGIAACKRAPTPLPTVDALIAQLSGKRRLAAAKALSTHADVGALARAVPALIRQLDSSDYSVRSLVAHAIGRSGKDALPALEKVLAGGSTRARRSALTALALIGAHAAKTIGKALADRSSEVRDSAGFALVELGRAALPALLEASKSRNETTVTAAASTIRRLKPSVLTADPALAKQLRGALVSALLRVKGSNSRWACVYALRRFGPATLPTVLHLLARAKPDVRNVLLRSLRSSPPAREHTRALVGAVIPLLATANRENRETICRLLEAQGAQAAAAVPALIATLEAEAKRRRARGQTSYGWPTPAGAALVKIGPAAVTASSKLLAAEDSWLHYQALQILRKLGPVARIARSAITTAMKRKGFRLRREAEETLSKIR